ncbi:MAG: hypothetical protein FWE91_11485 [Defluviitaleaceae bacterium]|nr:hypothetical protein [Defluviitaleaceae bacterium]
MEGRFGVFCALVFNCLGLGGLEPDWDAGRLGAVRAAVPLFAELLFWVVLPEVPLLGVLLPDVPLLTELPLLAVPLFAVPLFGVPRVLFL